MRILQVSDLHFGKHNAALMSALKLRIEEIKPEVIVATGDLVNTPNHELFSEARTYLNDLGRYCPVADGDPAVIAIPGNHDIWHTGVFGGPKRANYDLAFSGFARHHYFAKQKVWIWGFDSASKHSLATGEVIESDLVRFHQDYETLRHDYPDFEAEAFKIALIHHHPLPVNWDTDWQQRLLMMTNAGTFLSAMLNHKMNLVLHGHEHLQGRSRLVSALGGDENAELVVVSLGATLRSVSNPNHNWFNVVTIGPPGEPAGREVKIESFPSADQYSFRPRGETYTVQSPEQGRKQAFQNWMREAGVIYSEVASIADINQDGDCKRVVECEGMEILSPSTPRREKHVLDLPYTSGYFDLMKVSVDPASRYQGIYMESETGHKLQTETVTIRWGQGLKLPVGEKVSYQYQWWLLNAFAMDGYQFRQKYRDPRPVEFTHFPVVDPIRDLLVVVRFPKGFSPAARPQIRITKIDGSPKDNRSWERMGDLERELADKKALRYLESLGVAALRVRMPQRGYCYGIEWSLAEAVEVNVDLKVQELQNRLLKASRDTSKAPLLLPLANELGRTVLEELLPNWAEPVEIVCMFFDEAKRKLLVVSAAMVTPEKNTPLDKSHVEFNFGEGIAGRAFKGNEGRLYIHRETQNRTTPNHYLPRAGEEPHAVLVCLPLRSATNRDHVFGVLNVGSYDPACPLRETAEFVGPIPEEKIKKFFAAVSTCALNSLQAFEKTKVI